MIPASSRRPSRSPSGVPGNSHMDRTPASVRLVARPHAAAASLPGGAVPRLVTRDLEQGSSDQHADGRDPHPRTFSIGRFGSERVREANRTCVRAMPAPAENGRDALALVRIRGDRAASSGRRHLRRHRDNDPPGLDLPKREPPPRLRRRQGRRGFLSLTWAWTTSTSSSATSGSPRRAATSRTITTGPGSCSWPWRGPATSRSDENRQHSRRR